MNDYDVRRILLADVPLLICDVERAECVDVGFDFRHQYTCLSVIPPAFE